jgi:hypothetical protein
MGLDAAWAQAVCEACDPVFAAADVGFERQIHQEAGHGITALLWEAVPQLFAERYPESGIVESYGGQWPSVSCIDSWAYIENDGVQARISTEMQFADRVVALTGVGPIDGKAIAVVMATTLGVSPPQP